MKRKKVILLAVMLTGVLGTQSVSAGIFKEQPSEETVSEISVSGQGNGPSSIFGNPSAGSDESSENSSDESSDSILDNIMEQLPEDVQDEIMDIARGDSTESVPETSASIYLDSYVSSSGTEYYGCMKDGELNGYGAAFYTDSDSHMGVYENGMRNGFGVYIFESGDMIAGSDVDDVTQGNASYIYADNSVFAGEYEDNLRSGEGVLIDTANNNKITIGLWEDGDLVSGYDYEQWEADGITYYGQKVNGKIDGWGIQVYPSGNMYIGKHAEGLEDEFGVFYYQETDSFVVTDEEYEKGGLNFISIYRDGEVIIEDVDVDGRVRFTTDKKMELINMANGESVVVDSISLDGAGTGIQETDEGSEGGSFFEESEPEPVYETEQADVPEASSGKPKSRSVS